MSGFASGPCASEVRALAGAADIIGVFLQPTMDAGPLATGVTALDCRAEHCRRACNL
jgi:hypothetical protein